MRVLVIEDDYELLEELEDALSGEGFETVACRNSGEAIGLYRARRFDVVVTDLKMPVLDGFGLLRAILALDPQARVIILTAWDDPENRRRAAEYGAIGFYRKPLIDMEEFFGTLRRIALGSRDESGAADLKHE
ncbi:response regulator [bacterium]|nr:response regulator [bacterium]